MVFYRKVTRVLSKTNHMHTMVKYTPIVEAQRYTKAAIAIDCEE